MSPNNPRRRFALVQISAVARCTALLAAAMLSLVLHVSAAHAGSYDVYACDSNIGGGATPSWAGVQDVGLTAYSNCASVNPEGIVARTVGDGTNSLFQGGYAIFDAPPGTSVDSIHADIQLSRPDCTWGVGLMASDGDLAGRTIYYLTAGSCGVYGVTWLHQDLAVNATRVRIEARCGASSCHRSSSNPAEAQLRSVRVTVADPTPPSLTNPRGALWESDGWLAGSQDVAFDASDGAGISRSQVLLDGQSTIQSNNPCDMTQRSPCPNIGLNQPLDTSKIRPDGVHQLALTALDAAGNPTTVSKSIRVDNTPPSSPQGLQVAGGETWRGTNNFAVSWANPATDGVAPIAGADYQLCSPSGSSCTTGRRAGNGLNEISDVQVPGSGDWTLRLWLRDAAGNTDPSTSAPPVHLRYDDQAPDLAFEQPDPSDPTLVLVRASDAPAGIADGHIQIRREGTSTWQALPSSFDGTRISARLDDEHLKNGNYELQAWAIDAAGNERTTDDRAGGGAAQVRLPLRVLTRIRAGAAAHRKHGIAWRTRIRVHFGHRQRLSGQLLTADHNPIANSSVLVYSQERRAGAPLVLVGSLQTTAKGRFAYTAPKGPSRTIRFRFGGTATIRPSVRDVSLLVPARSTIHPDRRNLVNGEYVHLHGLLLGGEIPSLGKLVELQVLLRGHWHTFATARSDASGRWSYEYRFDGTRGYQTYRLRVAVPPETGYPFAPGMSHVVKIHVRGL
jgi:hypothetical protein